MLEEKKKNFELNSIKLIDSRSPQNNIFPPTENAFHSSRDDAAEIKMKNCIEALVHASTLYYIAIPLIVSFYGLVSTC